jgi:hypothetical protein
MVLIVIVVVTTIDQSDSRCRSWVLALVSVTEFALRVGVCLTLVSSVYCAVILVALKGASINPD